ncbi:hypothetical protein HNR56_002806 [Roseospira marina]|nr:hypothetical protein [Roseospira marina]MBB5088103.1 hypothetical protein [Roseospira marina]
MEHPVPTPYMSFERQATHSAFTIGTGRHRVNDIFVHRTKIKMLQRTVRTKPPHGAGSARQGHPV